MKGEVIKSVIAPVFSREGTILIALSSPEDKEENGFTMALQKNPHLFKMLHKTYVCEDCYKAGKRTVCEHRWLDLPAWCTPESLTVSKAIIDDDDDFARENLGLIVENGRNVFNKGKLTKMDDCVIVESEVTNGLTLDEDCLIDIFGRSHVSLNHNVNLVFVTIDPAAGTMISEKPTSEFCIISMAAPNTFLAIDSFPVRTHHDWDERLFEHIDKLRQQERLRSAKFVVAVEANNDHSASIIYEKLMTKFPNIIIPYSSNVKSGKAGTFTTSKSKVNMIELTQSVVVSKNMWFVDPLLSTDPKGPDRVKQMIKEQFIRFSREVHLSKDTLGRATVMYTGQLRRGELDDCVVTTMRNVLLQLEFFQNKAYEKYWYA